jgi:hypothetical protein
LAIKEINDEGDFEELKKEIEILKKVRSSLFAFLSLSIFAVLRSFGAKPLLRRWTTQNPQTVQELERGVILWHGHHSREQTLGVCTLS